MSLEDAWLEALSLSESGKIHEAVYKFESVHSELARQLEDARRQTGSTERVQHVLKELLTKLDSEIEAHIAYLRGNLFAALEIETSAGTAQVRKAYRGLALRYHPDKSRVSPRLFTIVKQAYETLSDPSRRRRYLPHKTAQEWTSWRQRHSAHFKATCLGRNRDTPANGPDTVASVGVERTPPRCTDSAQVHPRAKDDKQKESTSSKDDRPEVSPSSNDDCTSDSFPSSGSEVSTVDILRAATAAERRKITAGLSEECLRSILKKVVGQSPTFFGRGALVSAVQAALESPSSIPGKPAKRGFVNQFRSRMPYSADSISGTPRCPDKSTVAREERIPVVVADGAWFWG